MALVDPLDPLRCWPRPPSNGLVKYDKLNE
jgi:hypothetical protein